MNEFEKIRWKQTALLMLPILLKKRNDILSLQNGIDPYAPKFNGFNPLTGSPCTVTFDEPKPGASSILQWSPNLNSWTYSDNAGVKWQRVEFMDYVEKVDCLMSEPKYHE